MFYRVNKEDHHVVERTALPDHLIQNAQGQLAFEETMPRVSCVSKQTLAL